MSLKRTGDTKNKLYYSISEVSRITDIKAYVLRFWEKEFPTLKPKKNRGGNRIYQKREIDLINRIKTLLYDEGYTIDGARQKLKLLNKPSIKEKTAIGSNGHLKNKIKQIKKELQELQKLFT